MGSASSKFKKYIQNGDEFAAMQIHQSSPELRKSLEPNLSYGENHHHNTALHYAAQHGMKHLLRMFLTDLGGNPNKRNGHNETVLHCACILGTHRTYSAQERRASCVQLLLQWRGPLLNNGERERVDINALDYRGNTALHASAENGLFRCSQLLIAAGSDLFIENKDGLTASDLAVRKEHHHIARLLEEKIVFGDEGDVNEADIKGSSEDESYSGLRSQDLQEAKDQLLVETSDMLNIPLFTAEALLRDNEWSREMLLENWMRDQATCCLRAGVPIPGNSETKKETQETQVDEESLCGICLSPLKRVLGLDCGHKFCRSCWGRYLSSRIQDGDSRLVCPASECRRLVGPEVVETLVSPDVAKRYLQFDIEAFVEHNKTMKWCPRPGCGRAVKFPESENIQENSSHNVDCGSGHYFCWECLGDAHAPSSCSDWRTWLEKIKSSKPEEPALASGGGSGGLGQLARGKCESEDAANSLWLVTNSKPCPQCKSPIQKNEGCNHMRCSKCKFDFCWLCMESWKKHSSATGGYFRCNRLEAVQKADDKQAFLISQAVVRKEETYEMRRFLDFYSKFRSHERSRIIEESLLNSVHRKMELLAFRNKERDTSSVKFIEEGAKELLKARRILCGSYVYGYYMEDTGCNRNVFEFMLKELEESTEKLGEMVGRPYLRSPRLAIVETTALVRRKRNEFRRALASGWVPPDTQTQCDDPDCQRDDGNKLTYSRMDKSTSYQNVTGDDNMELVIALEMSRLQMIEDQVKKYRRQESISGQNSSGVSGDAELALALQLSLATGRSQRDLTVDNFLRTLVGIDLRKQRAFNLPRLLPRTGEEGRFETGDVHTSGVYCPMEAEHRRPRRSRSTGDLARQSEPRYYVDSDHSSHEDRPEEVMKKLLASKAIAQSSLESASDTINPDLEVSWILDSNREKNEENSGIETEVSSGSDPETRPPLYISGVSISRTPEPPPGTSNSDVPSTENCDELSSILHVEERNLSSDDFHEAFFLREGRRKRRSKKGHDGCLDTTSKL